jgi:hypothetical protein
VRNAGTGGTHGQTGNSGRGRVKRAQVCTARLKTSHCIVSSHLRNHLRQLFLINNRTPVRAMKKQQLTPQDKALVERQIASGLRSLYDKAILEPLPEAMQTLLDILQAREGLATEHGPGA